MKITGVGAVPLAIPLAPSTPESSWAAGIGKQILVRWGFLRKMEEAA